MKSQIHELKNLKTKSMSATFLKTLFAFVLTIILTQTSFANTITKDYAVKEFSKLKVSSAFQVEFIHSAENKVIVEADESAAKNVIIENSGSELVIKLKDNTGSNTSTLKAKVYGNSLSGIFISGASYFTSDYSFNEKETSIKSSGASKVEISLITENLNLDISGASKVTVKGSATKQIIDISGASFYNGKNCKNTTTLINASGASKATINCLDTLDAQASGASYINCVSTPKTIHKTTSGASSVETDE